MMTLEFHNMPVCTFSSENMIEPYTAFQRNPAKFVLEDGANELEFENDANAVRTKLEHLVTLYKDVMKTGNGQPNVVSGGLQRYIIRMETEAKEKSILWMDTSLNLESSGFHSLPVNVKLHIFSFMAPEDLCRWACVDRECYDLTSDDILWSTRLKQDMKTWGNIGHTTNPQLYHAVQSDWSNKEIYLQCCPRIRKLMKRDMLPFVYFGSLLRMLLPKKTPKIAMFGPGLETSTKSLVRRMLNDRDRFVHLKMFPGLFDGVGGGFTLEMINQNSANLTFDLSILYSSSKRERERGGENRMHRNRLIQHNQRVDDDDIEAGAVETYELTHPIRHLCHLLDAFIYVVDATKPSTNNGTFENAELFAMLHERWSATHVPVLILSCVATEDTPRVPCIDVVHNLDLIKLNRPWQVYDITVDTLSGLPEALHWLIEQAHRH